MSRVCMVTGKKPVTGNNVSHAKNRTKMVQKPNVQSKRIWVPEETKFVRVKLSTRALRTVDKLGMYGFIRKNNLSYTDFGLAGPTHA